MIEAELPDGTVLEFPEGTSPDVVQRVVKQRLGVAAKPEPSAMQNIGQTLGNIGAGALRGAGSIGATLIRPFESAQENAQRRADMDAALGSMGAETDSFSYGAGKLGAEIAGTAGAGGALAKGVSAIPGAAKYAAPLIEALRTGGFSAGGVTGGAGLAVRGAGGAATGGISAAMVNPGDAGMGAAVGGALPVIGRGVATGAQAVGRSMRPVETKIAEKLATQSGLTTKQLVDALNQQGPQLIPGYQKTVPQILQNDVLSQLQRTLKTAGVNTLGEAERVQQSQFGEALNRIAPVRADVVDAAQRAGSAIQGYALPAREQASKAVRGAFEAVDPFNETQLFLPIDEMQGAANKYLGAGTFGTGTKAAQAIKTAQEVTQRKPDQFASLMNLPLQTSTSTVPFGVVQNLRSSIGEAAEQASMKGANKEAAALREMVAQIDSSVNRAAGSGVKSGEYWPKDIADQYREALKMHQNKMLQFETGPQAGMFRKGGDGQASIQGAEIPGRFYSGAMSQADDVKAFKRLIGDREGLAQELKSFAMTQGAAQADAQGNLGSKFVKWLAGRSGANKELLSPSELATINEVGNAVQNQIRTESMGRVTGSDTAQKLAALQSNGMIDSKFADVLANKIPLIGSFTGPMLQGLRNTSAQTKNEAMARLLADPQAFSKALENPKSKSALVDALRKSSPALSRAAPVILAD